MIVLDTNVVSEPLRTEPSPQVLAWMQAQTDVVAVTSVTLGELWTGVRLLPAGRRRDKLARAMDDVLADVAVRLPYDDGAARIYADFRQIARAAGRGMSTEDGMIAAVCAAHGAALVTRNTVGFDFLPVPLLNPWIE